MIAEVTQWRPLSDRVQVLRDTFLEEGHNHEATGILLAATAVMVVLIAAERIRHWLRAREPDRPHRLFRRLLRGLGLTARQRRLLRDMAAHLRLEHPAVLLLSPQIFAAQSAAWAKVRGRVPTDELAAVAKQLFEQTPLRPPAP
jgi:hypothetical protein